MHRLQRLLLLGLFSLLYLSSFAQGHFTWSELAREAYRQTLQLRFTEAQTTLEQLQRQQPDNLVALHIANYQDFLRVYINEDEAEFRKLEAHKDQRLKRIRREGDPTSPWYLYLQADIRLQWALGRLKFEEYATAFFEVNKAFRLLADNSERFPYFLPNKKDLGILHAMVGTIPENYQWAVEWLSAMEGTLAQGQAELEDVLTAIEKGEDFLFEEEAYVLYAYLMLHLNRDDQTAWTIIEDSRLDPRTNLLACFVMANVALRSGRNDRAIELLLQRPRGPQYHPFPYLDFMLGVAKLQRLDPDASAYLERYLTHFRGRNFRKEARQKLAWHFLLQGDTAAYYQQMQLCRQEGYLIVGGDVSAQREAEAKQLPHPDLLRARLLFDGGYYDRAAGILQALSSDQLPDRFRLEYRYRLGRIYHQQMQYHLAVPLYRSAVEEGREAPWYYACRAALELGHIHETLGDRDQARAWFRTCLDIRPAEHATGLHQAAKSGLSRLR